MGLKDEIIQYAKTIGVDLIGFTHCEPFEEIREILETRKREGYLSGFEEKDIEKRIDPRKTLENCRSILVIGQSYYRDESKIREENPPQFYGELARTAWGRDYHLVLGEKMKKIIDFLNSVQEGCEAKAFVDTGPLVDRQVAYRAGLGFYGFNNAIINETYGSWVFIGYILTNIPIEPDKPLEKSCLECGKCIEKCPNGAIEGPHKFNANKCLSNILQKKGEIPREIRSKLGKKMYGCDICQEVCPHNFEIREEERDEFLPKNPSNKIDLVDLLNISNKEFERTFKSNASGWRGKKVLQRNGIIAMVNHGDKGAMEHLVPMLNDPRPEIRKLVMWAVSELGGDFDDEKI